MGTVDLTYTGLAVGMLLMLIPFYFLWRFRTGLLSSALWGTVRMTVQLLLIGVYLRFLFQWDNEWVNVLWMAVMAVIEPPGELMYIITSRFGSWLSKTSSWAMMSSAEVSSTCTPMKMMRSSNRRE